MNLRSYNEYSRVAAAGKVKDLKEVMERYPDMPNDFVLECIRNDRIDLLPIVWNKTFDEDPFLYEEGGYHRTFWSLQVAKENHSHQCYDFLLQNTDISILPN